MKNTIKEQIMKQKRKLILDAVLAALLILLMCYSFTGGLLHEILGITIIAGFIVHVFINRKYYGAAIRAIRRKKCSTKNKIAFAVNIILPVDAVIMLVSSFAISHDLFPGISKTFGAYNSWVAVHVICAVILLICVLVHVCMHLKMFTGMIKKAVKSPKVVMAWRAGSRITAVILAILIIKVSIDNVIYAAENIQAAGSYSKQAEVQMTASAEKEIETTVEVPTSVETPTSAETPTTSSEDEEDSYVTEDDEESYVAEDDEDSYAAEDDDEDWKAEEAYYEEETEEYYNEPDPEPQEPEMTLADFLGSMNCSGCGKHCSLLSPRCGKGESQAEQATYEYNEIYGV